MYSCLGDARLSRALNNKTDFYLGTLLPAKILHIPFSLGVSCRPVIVLFSKDASEDFLHELSLKYASFAPLSSYCLA